jgi:hypothetical protein
MFAGLIARQKLSLVMPGFKSLSDKDKWWLFDKWVQHVLEFPAEIKPYEFRHVMKTTAKAWRTHKSKLKTNFIKKGLTIWEAPVYRIGRLARVRPDDGI